MDGTLWDTTASGQSELGNNDNQSLLHILLLPQMEPHLQIQFSIMPGTTLFARASPLKGIS